MSAVGSTHENSPFAWRLGDTSGLKNGRSGSQQEGAVQDRRAISVPLTPVRTGLSRSLADSQLRSSVHVRTLEGSDSQADGPRTHRLIRERRSAQPNTSAPMAPTIAPYSALNPPVVSMLTGNDLPVAPAAGFSISASTRPAGLPAEPT
jgi:hypothetical protein